MINRLPGKRSLKTRLLGTLVTTTLVVLLLAGGANFVYQSVIMRAGLERQTTAQADMIAANAGAALLFDDSAGAQEVLQISAGAADIVSVEIFDRTGARVAGLRHDKTASWWEPRLRGLGLDLEVYVERPVIYSHIRQGKVVLLLDLEPTYRGLLRQAMIDLVILCGAVSLATAFGWRMQRALIRPILHLSDLAETVAMHQDYASRAQKFEDDEVGQLAERFNEMLGRIQERDAHLEKLVKMRTAELMEANEKLAYRAYHDTLTGLPNQQLFQDRLQQAIAAAARNRQRLAVMFMDLDEFKEINDTLGHEYGDKVLQSVARRLHTLVRESDTVARIGGDEFMFLYTGLHEGGEALPIAQKILAFLQTPMPIDGHFLRVSASLGVSLYPEDGQDAVTLKKHADMAMYHAKNMGRNRFSFFTRNLDEQLAHRIEIEKDLRDALGSDRLAVHYQPQVDVGLRLTGFEALIRWPHPDKGMIPPGIFIPIAEQSGLIAEVDEWILRAVCLQVKAWHDSGLVVVPVAVNLSMRLFRQPDLPQRIDAILKSTEVEPSWIHLEVTESTLMENSQQTIEFLRRLRDQGLQLAIDDFGTGYSSLNYLKRFPVHNLKIDQSFIRELSIDNEDAVIVLAIIQLAHSLGLSVTAEGVENQEQLDFLRVHRCDCIQGYYTGRPAPADEVAGLLARAQVDGELAADHRVFAPAAQPGSAFYTRLS